MDNSVFIIIGGTAQGLALFRELGKIKANVYVLCQSKKQVAYHSKYKNKLLFNNVEELDSHISKIQSLCNCKPICYITSGEALALILSNYNQIYNKCDVYPRPLDKVSILSHKDLMYDFALKHGMATKPYLTLDKYKPGTLKYPIILKRNYEVPLFFKVLRPQSEEELQAIINQIPNDNLCNVIAQEKICIEDKHLMEVSCQGYFVEGWCCGLLIAYQKRKLKKGLTAAIEEIDDELLKSMISTQVENFMADTSYSGFAEFEYMFDKSTRDLFFLEINTRPCGEQSAMSHKFENIIEVLLEPNKRIQLVPKTDHLCWMNILRDIKARFERKNFHNIFDIFKSHYDVFSWRDIKPFLSQIFK